MRTSKQLRQILDVLATASPAPAALAEATARLDVLLGTQDLAPESRTYGQLPFELPGRPGDLNAALFCLPALLGIAAKASLLEGAEGSAPGLTLRLGKAADAMVTAAERRWDEEPFDLHRDGLGYTNVFLLHVRALALGAAFRKDERLRRRAMTAWRRWFEHSAYFGIDEFLSPTYTRVDLEVLADLRTLFAGTSAAHDVVRAQSVIASHCRAVTHPVLDVPICGMSRCYRRSFHPGASPTWTQALGRLPVETFAETAPPPTACEPLYPRRASGRATAVPFRWTSFQQPAWGLGSFTGGPHVLAAGPTGRRRWHEPRIPRPVLDAGGTHHDVGVCRAARRHRLVPLFPDRRHAACHAVGRASGVAP